MQKLQYVWAKNVFEWLPEDDGSLSYKSSRNLDV